MIRVCLFDVDGVLIRGEAFSTYLRRDYRLTQDDTAPFFQGIFRECLIGKADLKEVLPPYLPKWGWQESIDAFLEYWFGCERHVDELLLATIQQWRCDGMNCYVATNQEQYRTAYLREALGFAHLFDGIFASAHVGHMKHERAFFELVLRELAPVPANEIMFWDDSELNVTTARQAGLQAEVYTDFADFQQKMRLFLAQDI